MIEKPVGKSLSESRLIRQGSEYITRYIMQTICLPHITKYDSMNRDVTLYYKIESGFS